MQEGTSEQTWKVTTNRKSFIVSHTFQKTTLCSTFFVAAVPPALPDSLPRPFLTDSRRIPNYDGFQWQILMINFPLFFFNCQKSIVEKCFTTQSPGWNNTPVVCAIFQFLWHKHQLWLATPELPHYQNGTRKRRMRKTLAQLLLRNQSKPSVNWNVIQKYIRSQPLFSFKMLLGYVFVICAVCPPSSNSKRYKKNKQHTGVRTRWGGNTDERVPFIRKSRDGWN